MPRKVPHPFEDPNERDRLAEPTIEYRADPPPEVPASPAPARRGGRSKAFQEETVKVALFLPPDLAGSLKALATSSRRTPSQVVAGWIHDAEIREAVTRGRQAFEQGDVVSHEEATRRLARW